MLRSVCITLASLSVIAALGVGCKSSDGAARTRAELRKPGGPHQVDPVIESLRPTLDIQLSADGSYDFIFSAGAGGTSDSPQMVALRDLRSVSFTVLDPRGVTIDSLVTNEIPTSGIVGEGGVASLTAAARVTWRPSDAVVRGTSVEMWVQGDEGGAARTSPLPLAGTSSSDPRREPLRLVLDVETIGTRARFRLEVERMAAGPADEFLPSGERFRIEIFDDRGEQVWSSSTGRMFTQAIQPVPPERVGEKITYSAEFNGTDERTHRPLPPGRYSVVATIPAMPRPYMLREELQWSGSR